MEEASGAERLAYHEDRRMWRLLLARLHPDAGGDHELFTFACAVKEEVLGVDREPKPPECEKEAPRGRQHLPDPFLRPWQDSMSRWSSSNHDALRSFRSR